MSNFEFLNNPIIPGQQTYHDNIYQQVPQQQYYPIPQQPVVAPAPISPVTTGGGYGFTIVPDEEENLNSNMVITSPIADTIPSNGKRRGRPKKEDVNTGIIKAEGEVEDISSIYSYQATNAMLHETVQQIDMLALELKEELDNVRLSRTFKNKHNPMVGLADGLGKLLATKVSAISQINSSIGKANDLDYKREKDRRAAEANTAADDKYLMDLYSSFIKNPMGNNQQDVLGPNMMIASTMGTNIVRADVIDKANDGQIQDAGYLNYLSRMTPEQNMMFYENNPNVKTVVVYDSSTGNKFFQVMDISTGQAIPNVPVMDNRFMEDTYIDLKNKIARNNNLHESYPVIVINEGVVAEY